MVMARNAPLLPGPAVMVIFFILGVLTSLPQTSLGCFPLDDLFAGSRHWMQTISMHSRRHIEVKEDAEDIMIVETEGLAKNKQWTLRCMMAYGHHRFLVKLVDEHGDDSRYRCYQFTPLTPHVIRQGWTEENVSRKKVNCIEDPYTVDEAVLVAYRDIQPMQCPLAGGYQLLMHGGMSPASQCLQSVHTYNPHVHFHCDGRGSGNVLVDFGQNCEPAPLISLMGGHHLTNLRCVGEWQENGFNSLLLQMRDHPESFWCLHYKDLNTGNGGVVSSSEEFLKVFLTVDGRCSTHIFGEEDVPKNTSMFGHLIAYRPENDFKCSDKKYLEGCKSDTTKCLDSVDCPSSCGRCQKRLPSFNCSFPENTLGTWKVINSRNRHLVVTVERTKISSSTFGDFLCAGPPEVNQPKYTYPAVQVSMSPSCVPFHVCVEILSSTPGLLNFQLRPAFRSLQTGDPVSCQETNHRLSDITPPEPEESITLVNLNKLQKTTCKHPFYSTYPTARVGCKLVVRECFGSCQSLNVSFDGVTCDDDTEQTLDNMHTCYATMDFEDGVQGILAKASATGRYMCWLFGSSRLFISTPEDCNQESVNQIFSDMSAHIRYDPLGAISFPLSGDDSVRTELTFTLFVSLAVLVCGWLL